MLIFINTKIFKKIIMKQILQDNNTEKIRIEDVPILKWKIILL